MRPNYYDDPVIDELGNIHTLEEYCNGSGGDISNSPVTFTSDDNIQNPDTPISMPLFKSGNALKDLMRWISKAFQNIRYLLKKVSDLDSDININTEKIGDIEDYTSKIWTDTTVALAGEYYLDENKIWKCLVDNSHKPSEGADWTQVKVMDEVSELNDALANRIKRRAFTLPTDTNGIIEVDLTSYSGFNSSTIINVVSLTPNRPIMGFYINNNILRAKVVTSDFTTLPSVGQGIGIAIYANDRI